MRILQVHNRHRVRGGEDVVVEREAELLRSNGHEVVSEVFDNPVSIAPTLSSLAQAPWNRSVAVDIVGAATAHAADVVHVHNTWFAVSPAVFPALAKAGFPVVATLHNFRPVCMNGLLMRDGRSCEECVGTGPWSGIRHRCYRDSLLLSTIGAAAIAVPRWRRTWERDVAQFVVLDDHAVVPLTVSGIPSDRITISPNFVPDPGPRPNPPSLSREVVYVGRLSEEKGAGVLLDVWRRASPEGLTLTYFGDGPLASELARSPVDGVHFAGRVGAAELTSTMCASRALIFPSICREAGPIAPIEAAAAGLPVVTTSLVGFASRITEAGAGWSVPARDPSALARALNRLGEDAAVDLAGSNARRMYESSHRPETALRSLEAIYEGALLQGRNNRVNGRRTCPSAA